MAALQLILDANPRNVQRTCRLGAPPRPRLSTALPYSPSPCSTCQGDTANHAGSSSSTATAAAIWLIKIVINVRTAITQVGLPYYNRTNPQQGSKQARESILKLLCGMNNDVPALNYRSDIKLDGNKDQYYAAAPAWSTLSGGNNPTHTCTPAQICEWVLDAVTCVP